MSESRLDALRERRYTVWDESMALCSAAVAQDRTFTPEELTLFEFLTEKIQELDRQIQAERHPARQGASHG